jgi:Domain of unknown function (DUF4276)
LKHLEILVEELSMAEALRLLVPQIIGEQDTYEVYPHQGKSDLLGKLGDRLRAYTRMKTTWPELRIVVVVDRDNNDCRELKRVLTDACVAAKCEALCRIAIEELEAWFFGDADALRAAYPSVPATLSQKAKYRDPDAIAGGTWEALERVLKRAGYYPTGMPKTEVAQRVAEYMVPGANRSRSFQVFRDGLTAL